MKFERAQSSSRSRQLHRQDYVLLSQHPELREKLNFRAIYPYLNQRRLLPDSFDQLKLVDGRATEQEQIDDIVVHLTKCDKDDYLKDFIDCLKMSESGTGGGHLELAQSLETVYNATVNMNDSDYDTPAHATKTDVKRAHKNKRYLIYGCVCTLVVLLLTIIMTCITLGVLSIPRVNNDAAKLRPQFTYSKTQNEEVQTPILEVDFGTDPFWISQANFHIEQCTGSVLIIDGAECHELPMNAIECKVDCSFLYYSYLSPGSVINITFANNITNSKLQLWRLNSAGWLEYIRNNYDFGSCDDPPSGSTCFHAQSFTGKTISEEIEKADFYFHLTRPSHSFEAIDHFIYMEKQYYLSAIRELYSPKETAIPADRSHTVTISSDLDFQQRRKCILLSSSCSPHTQHKIKIENVKRRMDALILAGIIGITLILVVLISVICVCIILWAMWAKLKRKYRSNVVVGYCNPLAVGNSST